MTGSDGASDDEPSLASRTEQDHDGRAAETAIVSVDGPPVSPAPAPGGRIAGTLVVGVTGAVGAVTVPTQLLHWRMTGLFRDVHVVVTAGATRFVTPYALSLYSGKPVHEDTFGDAGGRVVPHVELAEAADALVVMPATANVLGKVANGICDDLLTSVVVACEAPVVLAPSMNRSMWCNPAVRRNVAILGELGHHVVEPGYGFEIADTARGRYSPTYGAMASYDRIADALRRAVAERSAAGPRAVQG